MLKRLAATCAFILTGGVCTADTAGLDLPLARDWALVRVVDYWLWALSIGLTEDPRRCATLLEWLAAI